MAVTGNAPRDSASPRWDLPAIVTGGVFSLVVGLGATGAATFFDSGSVGRTLLLLVFFGGFLFGAALAAWVQRLGMPMSHGIVTAAGTYLLTDAVFVVIKLIRGHQVNWLGIILKLTMMIGVGAVGGLIAGLLRRKGFAPSTERGGR